MAAFPISVAVGALLAASAIAYGSEGGPERVRISESSSAQAAPATRQAALTLSAGLGDFVYFGAGGRMGMRVNEALSISGGVETNLYPDIWLVPLYLSVRNQLDTATRKVSPIVFSEAGYIFALPKPKVQDWPIGLERDHGYYTFLGMGVDVSTYSTHLSFDVGCRARVSHDGTYFSTGDQSYRYFYAYELAARAGVGFY